jgi:hypothetical protein
MKFELFCGNWKKYKLNMNRMDIKLHIIVLDCKHNLHFINNGISDFETLML